MPPDKPSSQPAPTASDIIANPDLTPMIIPVAGVPPEVTDLHLALTATSGDCGLIGDFNDDGEVTVADLIMIAEAWGLEAGDHGWNAMFDLRVDGRIDIVDVMMAAAHFGDQCP